MVICYCMYVPRFVGFGALLVPPVRYVDSCIELTPSCFCCNPEKIHEIYTLCAVTGGGKFPLHYPTRDLQGS